MGILVQDNPVDWILTSFKTMGVGRDVAVPIAHRLSLWLKEEGPESAVKRIKALKTYGLKVLANEEATLEWVKIDREGDPRGCWKPLFVWLRKGTDAQKMRALQVLSVSSVICFKDGYPPTRSQEEKFLGSVQVSEEEATCRALKSSSLISDKSIYQAVRVLATVLKQGHWDPITRDPQHIWEYIGEKYGPPSGWDRKWDERVMQFVTDPSLGVFLKYPQVRVILAPVLAQMETQKTRAVFDALTPEKSKGESVVAKLHSDGSVQFDGLPSIEETQNRRVSWNAAKAELSAWLHRIHPYSQILGREHRYEGTRILEEAVAWQQDVYDHAVPPKVPIGYISGEQQPGCKFRAFASPHVVLQASMEGLKRSLLCALKILPWDVTHDQHEGLRIVQEWLRQGEKCFSVDSSDASNNIPFWLQKLTLSAIGVPEADVSLFSLVCRSPYKVFWNGEMYTWNVGQPMGASPSFMSFALFHSVIALASELRAGIPLDMVGSHFVLLGDDIVVRSERVHKEYRGLLEQMSIPTSTSKCLASSVCAEFAGSVITPTFLHHSWKYQKPNAMDESFVGMVSDLGLRAVSLDLLPEAVYYYCQKVKYLPKPAGLGFQPMWRPLRKTVALQQAISEWHLDVKVRRDLKERATYHHVVSSVMYATLLIDDASMVTTDWDGSARKFFVDRDDKLVKWVKKQTPIASIRSLGQGGVSPDDARYWLKPDSRAPAVEERKKKGPDLPPREAVEIWTKTALATLLPIAKRALRGQPWSIRTGIDY
jgi:hypothetical protein